MGTPVCTYMPERTYIVDTAAVGEGKLNYLVRGNMPLAADGTIAYAELGAKLLELNPDLILGDMSLLVISLIDNQGELNDLELEFTGFGCPDVVGNLAWPPYFNGVDCFTEYGTMVNGNTQQGGSIVWFPVQGCTDDSNCALVENAQYDFCGLVAWLTALMSSCTNTVIYYHCEHGHDRTSALTAAYQMEWLKYPLDQVLDDKPPTGAKAFGHAWEATYEALVKWYATTLPTE